MERNKVDIEQVKRYVRGELSPREMHALERRAQDDPMLMDIVLGMELAEQGVHAANLADIRARIGRRTGGGRVRRLSTAQRWAVAASVLLAVTVSTVWFLRDDVQAPNELAVAPPVADERPIPSAAPERSEEAAQEPSAAEAPARAASRGDAQGATAGGQPRAAAADRLAVATEPQRETEAADETRVEAYAPQPKRLQEAEMARVAADEPTLKAEVREGLAANAAGVQVAERLSGQAAGITIRGTSASRMRPIKGKVLDSETQRPLPGAVLRLAGDTTVTTDAEGVFTISGQADLRDVALLGYELDAVQIAGKDTIVLAMAPIDLSLDEVVVVGYGRAKRQKASEPEPAVGWRAYNRYLKGGMRQADGPKGTVTLAFTVDGKGRPTDIRVLSSTNEALNDPAIRLVQQGADWLPGKNGERTAELKMRF